MAWFLYLIECNDGSIYTGIAVDVAARFAAHASGKGARYTRSRPPRRLLAIVAYPDRSTASKAEYAMKRLSAAEKRRFCLRREGLWCVAQSVQKKKTAPKITSTVRPEASTDRRDNPCS